MSITPLPVFEADADPRHRDALADQDIYQRLEPPKSIVVRFGYLKLIGEYKYEGDARPGCGTKLVSRTHRGTELVDMLTTTCENAGCSKSVSRREMLEYIENSGGKDYPFYTNGRILRVATVEDLNRQAELNSEKPRYIKEIKQLFAEAGLDMKLVEVEPILGGEVLTLYYMSEQRVDFREMVKQLAGTFRTRIEMRQVGARDEARLVADYERCGQHCCCQNFLKVLKPVSMRSAKVQKATLDPLKISGRCGRLMCCLRYEDQTYKELKAQLPPRNKRVGTSEGPGKVVDSRILVQLVLVRLESDGREIAVPVEELMDPDSCPRPDLEPAPARLPDPLRGMSPDKVARRVGEEDGGDETAAPKEGSERPKRGRRKRRRGKGQQQDAFREKAQRAEAQEKAGPGAPAEPGGGAPKSKRRRRRRKRRPGSESGSGEGE